MTNKPLFEIDTTQKIYRLDGNDISNHLLELNVKMKGGRKSVEMVFADVDVKLTGELVAYKSEAEPTVCECGFEISPHRFELNCICPGCGKNVRTSGGRVVCFSPIC